MFLPYATLEGDKVMTAVLSRNDNVNGAWNPQDVTATITFRGQQVRFFVTLLVVALLVSFVEISGILGNFYVSCWCNDSLVVCCTKVGRRVRYGSGQ